eukprot:6491362-Amphidinium_carterae.4
MASTSSSRSSRWGDLELRTTVNDDAVVLSHLAVAAICDTARGVVLVQASCLTKHHALTCAN